MLANLMNKSVNVKRPTVSQGTSLGEVDTLGNVYTGRACNIQPVSSQWKILWDARHLDATHWVFFNKSLSILVDDEIYYGSRRFLVLGFRNLVELGRVWVADAKEIT